MLVWFAIAVLGGVISHLCGLKKGLPWGLDQWAYALPYALSIPATTPMVGLLMVVPLLGALYGKRTGHGQYIHLGFKTRQPEVNDEPLDWIIRLMFGPDRGGNYWRSVAGLAVTGMAVTLIPGICMALTGKPLAGAFLAVSGASKAVAYQIGWKLKDIGYTDKPCVFGEFLTGVFGWALLLACL